jgi:hypothetical protein
VSPGYTPSAGLSRLSIGFLAISIPVETVYSWRLGLADPYYLAKVVGWILLAAGVAQLRTPRPSLALALLAAGWSWFAANFWRAVADRFARLAAAQVLRLGSLELWFAGSCLLISLIGLAWSLVLTSRRE